MAEVEVEVLARRFGLGPEELGRLQALADVLAADPAAPISASSRGAVAGAHLADALVGLELATVRDARSVVDIGSGAGIPALPLAIALPTATVVALDANARKVAFISRIAAECGLENVTAVAARAEAWPEGSGRFDLVTARALAPLSVIAEYAAPLLEEGGSLVAWRGRRDAADEEAGAAAAGALALAVEEVHHVVPYPGAVHRHLHVLRKVGPTPERFPRRVGVARKRPLGGRI